jgi:antitoxin component of MazEF toxin-antitoxin module
VAGRDRVAIGRKCYYSYYVATRTLKVARIGNSRGVRLPATSLRRYEIGETVVMEETSEGILLRPTCPGVAKLSWEDTARQMAASQEDWTAWDAADGDGLDDLPWQAATVDRVAEPLTSYRARPGRKRKR